MGDPQPDGVEAIPALGVGNAITRWVRPRSKTSRHLVVDAEPYPHPCFRGRHDAAERSPQGLPSERRSSFRAI